VNERRQVADVYEIVGVYADVPEVQRRAYGVADIVIPYTAVLPSNQNLSMAMRFLMGRVSVRVQGMSFEGAAAQIQSIVASEYGEDITVYVWEGQPNGSSGNLEETRRTVATFTLVVNLLGFVLLVTGSIGILSIMIVEVLGKSRDIALERALGANKRDIVKEFFLRAVIMSSVSAALGLALSAVFAGPIANLLEPILDSIGLPALEGTALTPQAVAVGALSAILVGGVFGTLPVFSTLGPPISESIRES